VGALVGVTVLVAAAGG